MILEVKANSNDQLQLPEVRETHNQRLQKCNQQSSFNIKIPPTAVGGLSKFNLPKRRNSFPPSFNPSSPRCGEDGLKKERVYVTSM